VQTPDHLFHQCIRAGKHKVLYEPQKPLLIKDKGKELQQKNFIRQLSALLLRCEIKSNRTMEPKQKLKQASRLMFSVSVGQNYLLSFKKGWNRVPSIEGSE